MQQTQLRQYQQRLRTLLGFDVSAIEWDIPERIVAQADLYQDPEFTQIPNMILAHAGINVARLQKDQARLSSYPTISVKGSLSQAMNGRNPNNNEDDGFYNSIMIEASSNFYQGELFGLRHVPPVMPKKLHVHRSIRSIWMCWIRCA